MTILVTASLPFPLNLSGDPHFILLLARIYLYKVISHFAQLEVNIYLKLISLDNIYISV